MKETVEPARDTRHIDIHAVQLDRVIAAGDSDGVFGGRTADGVFAGIRSFAFSVALGITSLRDDNGAISQIKLLTRRSLMGSSPLTALRFEFCGILSFLRAATARFSLAQTAVDSRLSIMTSDSILANNRRFIPLPPKILYLLLASSGWVYLVLRLVFLAQTGQPHCCTPARE